MKRRSVLKTMGAVSTHALFPSILASFLQSCESKPKADYEPVFFSPDELDKIIKIIDAIIPATSSPSASETRVHELLDRVFKDCLSATEQEQMRNSLQKIYEAIKGSEDIVGAISKIDQQAYTGNQDFAPFISLKKYTLIGFFTSKEGATRATRYMPSPGYIAELPATPETISQAKTNLQY